MLPERRRFCAIPFKYMEIRPDGSAVLCCHIPRTIGTVRPGSDLREVYNSRTARRIRESILDGTFRYCDLANCPHFAGGSLPLQQDCAGTRFEQIVAARRTRLDEVGVWLSIDPRCNLRCVTCRPGAVEFGREQARLAESLLATVKDNLPVIRDLGLSGSGDPFVSPLTRGFLEEFDAQRHPETRLTLLTNGLLLDRQRWEGIARAQSAIRSIQVSIDAATAGTYERIRLGGNWERLQENLVFLAELHRARRFGEFIISFVVTSWNFQEMEAFVDLGERLGCSQVYFARVARWGFPSDEGYRDLAVDRPEHPRHPALRQVLNSPRLGRPIVMLGNLAHLRTQGILRDSIFS